MDLIKNGLYTEDINSCISIPINWKQLENKNILITGASGMIGKFLIDVLMCKEINCKIYAIGRNIQKARERFQQYWDDANFVFFSIDINQGIDLDAERIDYIIHAASNTHPVAYAMDPVGTVTTNVIGTYNVLELARKKHTQRVLFLSSVEIYGENRDDCERFTEDYCGYIDCNTMRAGYPESKRVGEALGQAYINQYGLDIVFPRLSRVYGPSMQMDDSKAIAQFIKKGIAKENVVLKSEGNQFYSYTYVADCAAALLWCLVEGRCGEAYNVADERSDICLKDLAKIIADYSGTKVVYDIPDSVEMAGYSKATKALLDSSKLRGLGWNAAYSMGEGLVRTMMILEND